MSRAAFYPARASIKMGAEQMKLIKQRAKTCGVRPSVWMRSILMQAAKSASREQPADGYIRVREPEGITT